MNDVFIIASEDILYQLKLSCQLPDIIAAIATRKIITDAATKADIEIKAGELQQTADKLRLVKKLITAKDTETWLEKHYLSLNEFKELVQTSLLSAKLAEYLFAEQVKSFFAAHQLDYTQSITYEVVLDDEELAWQLFYELQENNISFQNIAQQYIQEPELRRLGGYCGIRYRSDVIPEIANYVFTAHPPQILKPILTHKGVHLIWVEEIIQPHLDEKLRCKILRDLFASWLQQQLEEMRIVVQI
ncbi:peptidylprolyl isomerase [Nostoc sp. FACHB-87]|uniref:peptidylprolyl isomerase n=1 Tax=Nostocaceae TaxID=1162 RepID=UPI001684F083|nr:MULTISPECIES: peptidylprolyl isomerase [Nostocaceae]MBD2298700.1 peptidylprolyl isomerase [Nostoc sp. FACHB-190]MBD2454470.1 peptidylprolyl isomerase [Nostoc sp. FACHB-87]MBD2474344.1 peptidylprolyl isomerase [Anabaena sp. FACHB-83]